MLELQNICYRVSTPEGELDILRDISITIPDQRLMVFTGPNGGGKTTLAKIIMGLVQPTSGRIVYNGQDVTGLSITERARLGISYGFQQPPRFKGITVHDLLRLAAGKEKLSKDQCCAYLTKVGLCANDYLAIGAIRAITEAGLSVPEDISVCGFDDVDVSAYFNPPLTTIKTPCYQMGKMADDMVIDALESQKPLRVQYLLDTELVVRATCNRPKEKPKTKGIRDEEL